VRRLLQSGAPLLLPGPVTPRGGPREEHGILVGGGIRCGATQHWVPFFFFLFLFLLLLLLPFLNILKHNSVGSQQHPKPNLPGIWEPGVPLGCPPWGGDCPARVPPQQQGCHALCQHRGKPGVYPWICWFLRPGGALGRLSPVPRRGWDVCWDQGSGLGDLSARWSRPASAPLSL